MKRLLYIFLSATLLLMLSLPLSVSGVECYQNVLDFGSGQVPGHFILYQDDLAPEWKKIWDQARSLYKQKKFKQAQVQYELLLARKENVDQARWEYVSTLICLEQWQKAETELGMLINHDPDRPEYQLAEAEIALGNGDFSSAVKVYAPLYEQCKISDSNEDTVRILAGYIAALEGLGRVEVLTPLMQQLIRLRPDDYELQKRSADIAIKNNQPQRALITLRTLLQSSQEDPEVLQSLARIQMSLGNRRDAASYWQQVVGLNGECRKAHEQLIDYYHWQKKPAMELKHVESLLLILPDDSDLLERAGRLHLALGRPDKALEYYGVLLSLQPGNRVINQLKQQALQEFAGKLLILVENNGPGMLWQDLARVTTDHAEVYLAMADMLRDQGRRDKLIEVLLVIHHEIPGDAGIRNELAALLKEQGRGNILASSRNADSWDPVILPQ
jgi:tetratricopeptide (TPR) repeat protein